MDRLLNPDTGLMFWTIVTFLTMVFLLGKFAWNPLLHSIEERENSMRHEREAAEKARAEAQRIQADLEAKLAKLDAQSAEILAKASKEAEALRARHTAEAHEDAKKLMDKTRAELNEEKRRLIIELRTEVASLAVSAAERLVKKSVDDGVRKSTMDEFYKDLEKPGKHN